jgi:hypothetical protein
MMREHHYIWLEGQPTRNKKWLQERLDDGFDIHHIDGNHANNHPMNLCLIEGIDHLNCIHLNTIDWKKKLREGRKHAMANGVRFGRKLKLTDHQRREALARRESGETCVSISKSYNVSYMTIARL